MRELKRSALIGQPPARLYALINDIESYPQFVPWCVHARVRSRSEREIVATLGVRRGALHGQFTTRNELEPETRIRMHLVEGPFKVLEGEWLLTPIDAEASRIDLSLSFAFNSRVAALMFEQLFEATALALLDGFVARARAAP